MKVKFDLFNRRRIPSLILCNPNGQEMFSMPLAKDRQLSLSLNELSELTFELPKYINNQEVAPYYDYVKTRRIIKLEDIGQFLITSVDTTSDGITERKQVKCKGLEFELSSKNLDVLEGTYKFYDPTNTTKSLMHIVMSYIPTWSIESIDSDLWNIYRTFDLQDNNIYNFLMGEVQEAYDCVFLFDTFNRTIKAVKTENIPKKTDIFMSNRNLMKELEISENADNIITALDVYGDGELSIRTVNPLGKPTIYDFSHFATTEWMTLDLVNAVNKWQEKVELAQKEYSDKLTEIKNLDSQLLDLKSDLADIEISRKESEQKQSMAVVAGDNASCTKYANEIRDIDIAITQKKQEITDKENQIQRAKDSLSDITKGLSFDNNFTSEQMTELSNFIYQASIQNTNYSLTDSTTVEEQQEMMYSLYNWGRTELKKSCQPVWEFSVESINFLNLIEYRETSSQLELGSEITIEVDKEKDLFATAILLGYSIDLDDFDDLKLKFSNRLNYKKSSFTFEELFDKTASISKSFDFESNTWNTGKEAYNMINEYVNNALDLTNQEIVASDNQEFTISNVGIRGREYNPNTKTYSQEQVWLNKNVLAFSDDGFRTSKTALGKISLPDGTKAYGLLAEVIVGKLLCGSSLVLQNENNTFKVDANGVYIKNANIVMTNDKGQDQTISEMIGSIDLTKYDNILTSKGLIDTSKMQGQILAGTNNIFCVNQENNKALLINDTGILIANTKTNGNWNWSTAISADGVVATNIKAGATIEGCTFISTNSTESMTLGSGTISFRDISNSSGATHISRNNISLHAPKGHESSINLYGYDATSLGTGCIIDGLVTGSQRFIIGNGNSQGKIFFNSEGGVYVASGYGSDKNIYFFNQSSGSKFICQMPFECTSGKSAIVPTQHYGVRTLYCDESDRSYFSTKGKAKTINNECVITLDDPFIETIELNSSYPYLIQLTPYSNAHVWVERVDDYSFVVKSDKETEFAYDLKAIRIAFGGVYLEEKELDKKILEDVQRENIERMK